MNNEITVKTSNEVLVITTPDYPDFVEVKIVEKVINVQVDHFYAGTAGGDGAVFELPLNGITEISVPYYDHQLLKVRGVAVYRPDGKQINTGYQVGGDLTVYLTFFRPFTGKILIF